MSAADIALLALMALGKSPPVPSTGPILIRVEFDAPAGCADVEAFYAGVLARSDRARRAGTGEEGVRLGVRLTRVGGKVYGELRVLDGRSDTETRKVEGGRCDEVVEVLSLTAALALDPAARLGAVRPPGAPPPAPASPAGPPPAPPSPTPVAPATPAAPVAAPTQAPPAPPAVAPPPARVVAPEPPPATARLESVTPRAFELGIGTQAVGARVLSPTLSFGGAISLRLARKWVVRDRRDASAPSVGLGVSYLSNDLLSSADEAAATWTAIALTACPGWALGQTVVLELCAQALGGWLAVTDRAVTNPRSVGRTWGSAGALGRASTLLGGGFSLELEGGLGVSLVERRFITTTPERTVGQTPTVSATFALGIAHGF